MGKYTPATTNDEIERRAKELAERERAAGNLRSAAPVTVRHVDPATLRRPDTPLPSRMRTPEPEQRPREPVPRPGGQGGTPGPLELVGPRATQTRD